MTTQILIRVDEDLKNTLKRLSRLEQKSLNEKIRELIEEYVKEHNMETAMKNLWDEIGESFKKKGYKKSDVDKMIQKVRAGK